MGAAGLGRGINIIGAVYNDSLIQPGAQRHACATSCLFSSFAGFRLNAFNAPRDGWSHRITMSFIDPMFYRSGDSL